MYKPTEKITAVMLESKQKGFVLLSQPGVAAKIRLHFLYVGCHDV